jgi:hypothetical protein
MTFSRYPTSTQAPARKSPLRVARLPAAAVSPVGGPQMPRRRAGLSGPDLRRLMISEYGSWLQTRTNKHHRPFQPDTILAYTETARVLDRWMSEQGIDGDFTTCDTAMLNRFFGDYIAAHGQGGTNTRQRNLRHLFTWLEDAYGHPHPYTDRLHRYSPSRRGPPRWPTSSSPNCWPSPEPIWVRYSTGRGRRDRALGRVRVPDVDAVDEVLALHQLHRSRLRDAGRRRGCGGGV